MNEKLIVYRCRAYIFATVFSWLDVGTSREIYHIESMHAMIQIETNALNRSSMTLSLWCRHKSINLSLSLSLCLREERKGNSFLGLKIELRKKRGESENGGRGLNDGYASTWRVERRRKGGENGEEGNWKGGRRRGRSWHGNQRPPCHYLWGLRGFGQPQGQLKALRPWGLAPGKSCCQVWTTGKALLFTISPPTYPTDLPSIRSRILLARGRIPRPHHLPLKQWVEQWALLKGS